MTSAITWFQPTDTEIETILREAQTIAIVGVSDKPDRPSFGVAKYLLSIPTLQVYLINPIHQHILGQQVFQDIATLATSLGGKGKIDIVDIFRNLRDLPEAFKQAMTIGPKVIWCQLGLTVSQELADEAEHLGIRVVMDRCTAIEGSRIGLSENQH